MMKRVAWMLFLALALPALYGSVETPEVIYGKDDRVLADSGGVHANLQQTLRATAAMIDQWKLEVRGEYFELGAGVSTAKEYFNLCPEVPLSKLPALAECTGVLVARDLILTAGHCYSSPLEHCSRYAWVFEWQNKGLSWRSMKIKAEEVYYCQEILELEDNPDFALIRLDREVVNRIPVEINRDLNLKSDSVLISHGHPMGMPQIISGPALIRENNPEANYFLTDLDSFVGNSGSPLFDSSTHKLEGILVQGRADFFLTSEGCNTVNTCNEDGMECLQEESTKFNFEKALRLPFLYQEYLSPYL